MIRLAGKALAAVGKNLRGSLGAMPKSELAFMIAPDLIFGGMYGMQTPGSAMDKAIAGAGSAIGGAVGGVGLRAGLGIRNPALGMGVDWMGSIGGDMVGVAAADQVLRAKNGGATPLEKMMMQQQLDTEARIKQEAKQELLEQLALRQRFN